MKNTPPLLRLCLTLSLLAALGACGGPVEAPDGGGDPVVDAGSIADAGPVASLSLLTTVPSAGATGASLSTAISLGFSSPVAQASLSVLLSPSVNLSSAIWSADSTEVSFPPLSLAGATSYTVTVFATGLNGAMLSGERSFTFTTAAAADTTAPSLLSSSPAQSAIDVVVGQAITLTFSEAMSVDSVALALDPAQDLSATVWNVGGTVATISAVTPLAASTKYTLSLSGSDLAGNPLAPMHLSFTTAAPPDTEAPSVLSSAPSPAAMSVPTAAALSLSFSEAMDKASVDGAFSIAPAVAGTVLWDNTSTLRSFQPSAPLTADTQYTITLGAAARDLAGNSLAAPFSFTFRTAIAPDVTAPTVVSSLPAAGDLGVARNSNIVVTFSEPMDKASAQVAFSVTLGPTPGAFSWSPDGKTMTFNPTNTLPYGQTMVWRVTTAARDLAGNALAFQVSRGFMVVREGVLVINASAALDGYVTNGNLVSTGSGFLFAGDNASNVAFRSFLSFDLSGLPETTQRLTQVSLFAYLSSWQGAPRTSLGGAVQLERLDYGVALEAADYDLARFMNVGDTLDFGPGIESAGWKVSTAALFPVTNDWTNREARGHRSQFRLRFPNQLSANGAADLYTYYSGNTGQASCPRQGAAAPSNSCKPHLIVTYEYP